jgi:2-methylcitrate dehydratase PrpD
VTILERLAAHVVGGYREGFSVSACDAARLHLADSVGAWVSGSGTAEGRALLRFESPDRESLTSRAGLNCALARLSEVDDIHLASATTPGALIVPAAVTLAAALGLRGAALSQAIAVGYDLMTWLGAALQGPWILYRGVWPTYLTAPLGVAAAAARLLDLTEQQAAHALGISLSLSSPAVGRQSGASLSRWLAIGQAARNGVYAALAAESGFTADLHIFESDFFGAAFNLIADKSMLAEALGERSALAETSFKPWCAARQTMAAAQSLRELIESGIVPSEMSKIAVAVPAMQLKMVDHGTVTDDRASFLTSLPYQLSLAAFAPEAMLGLHRLPASVVEDIRDFIPKVSITADEALLAHYPRAWPARVVVTTPAGAFEKVVLHVPGDPEMPFDENRVAAKFRRLVGPLLGEHATSELLQLSLAGYEPKVLLESVERAVAGLAPAVQTENA